MARAFERLLGLDFLLVSAKGDVERDPIYPFRWLARTSATTRYFRYLDFCIFTVRTVRSNRSAVVYTRDIGIALSAVCAGGRAVFEAHKEPHGYLPRFVFRVLRHHRDFRLVTISQALANHYRTVLKVDETRMLVAHDGVFPDDYDGLRKIGKNALRKKLALPNDKTIVVHTGSLARGGAELFVEVLRANSKDVLFVHLGGSAVECGEWSSRYARMGYKNIQFIPHQPSELVRMYQVSADLLFYVITRSWPTFWCTSPLKIFEYMASGVPIMGSRIGSIMELISEKNAYCYDPDEPNSIAGAWQRFREDPLGAAGRASQASLDAKTLFSWHERANRICRFAGISGLHP